MVPLVLNLPCRLQTHLVPYTFGMLYDHFLQAKEVAMKNQQLNIEIAYQSQFLVFKQQILKVDTFKGLHEEIIRTE